MRRRRREEEEVQVDVDGEEDKWRRGVEEEEDA